MPKPKGWCPLTDDEKQEIVRRYAAGERLTDLTEEFHRGKPALRKILTEAGITLRPRGYPKGTVWHDEWRAAHFAATQTPEFAEKSRKALLERLPRMKRSPAINSAIERRVQDALMKAGIGFTTQSLLLERYLVDIELHQARIVIEADGFQHKADDTLKAKDAERDAALAAAGYRVFRFTGSEINRDAAACVQRITDACGLVPELEPAYEIRTKFSGELHPLWKGGKREFTCDICGTTFMAQPAHRPGPDYYCTVQCAGAARRGKKLTAEHRAHIAAGLTGTKRRPYGPMAPETRAKISAALTGRVKTAEHVAKVAAAQRGKPRRRNSQIKIEPALRGDAQRPAEMTGPATLF